MKLLILPAMLFGLATLATAQPAPQEQQTAASVPAPLARHVVMFTREGANFAKLRDHMDEARAHQALYVRLAADGHTIAGGAFEGTPILGMTVFKEGIDEVGARELIADDQLPKLGIVEYEFRTLGVRMGSFGPK